MSPVIYAGFLRRLFAILVDSLCLLPLMFLYVWLSGSRTATLWYSPVYYLAVWSYHIYFHARYGQTPGKMAARISLLDVDLKPIRLRQAFLRSSVDIAL